MTNTEHFLTDENLTHGECLDPAMRIAEQADADNYLAAYVAYMIRHWGQTYDEALSCALVNIGYYAGYMSDETAGRVNRLFHTSPYPGYAMLATLVADYISKASS